MALRTFLNTLSRSSGTLTPGGDNVASVAAQSDVITTIGTAPTLPTTVLVTYDSGETEAVGVSWSAVLDEVGYYTLEGLLLLSSPNTNNSSIKAAINVIVDNTEENGSDYLYFDGYHTFTRYGDILDTTFAAANAIFQFDFTIRNYPLTGFGRFLSKADFTSTRSFVFQKIDNGVNFIYYMNSGATVFRSIIWAGCLTDSNEHAITLTYNGASTANNGLDRCNLYIDGVLVTAGKSMLSAGGALTNTIFNSTAMLSFGNWVGATGNTSTDTVAWYKGEVKNIVIRASGGTIIYSSLTIPRTASHGTYTKYEQPVYNGSKDSTAYDNGQASTSAIAKIGSNWHLYILAANPLINSDRDVVTMAQHAYNSDVTTGWVKHLTSGVPTVIYDVGATGKFDAKQVWLRNIMRNIDDDGYIGFSIGQSATDTFAMGKATSTDGINWTRTNSGNPVLTDGATDLTLAHIVRDTDNKLKGIYCGNQYGGRLRAIESSDDGDTWSITHSDFLSMEGLGWCVGYRILDDVHYLWFARGLRFFSQISREITLYTTTDFSTFTHYGPQVICRGFGEFGISSAGNVCFRLPDNRWAIQFTMYKYQIAKGVIGGEEFTATKFAILNRKDAPIASKACIFNYPAYVVEHYPLNREELVGLDYPEYITGGTATINSTPVYTPEPTYGNRVYGVDLNGSQNITNNTPIDVDAMDFSDFSIKLRVETVTTGTHELFRIGDTASNRSIIITLESGKLRVRISSDGTTWAKDWITTVNISKPTNMSYIDNHIYVGVIFSGGTMTLYNDFVAFTSGQLTKTTDGAITTMYYTNGARVIGNNATLEMSRVSILSGATTAEFIDLEL